MRINPHIAGIKSSLLSAAEIVYIINGATLEVDWLDNSTQGLAKRYQLIAGVETFLTNPKQLIEAMDYYTGELVEAIHQGPFQILQATNTQLGIVKVPEGITGLAKEALYEEIERQYAETATALANLKNAIAAFENFQSEFHGSYGTIDISLMESMPNFWEDLIKKINTLLLHAHAVERYMTLAEVSNIIKNSVEFLGKMGYRMYALSIRITL